MVECGAEAMGGSVGESAFALRFRRRLERRAASGRRGGKALWSCFAGGMSAARAASANPCAAVVRIARGARGFAGDILTAFSGHVFS